MVKEWATDGICGNVSCDEVVIRPAASLYVCTSKRDTVRASRQSAHTQYEITTRVTHDYGRALTFVTPATGPPAPKNSSEARTQSHQTPGH